MYFPLLAFLFLHTMNQMHLRGRVCANTHICTPAHTHTHTKSHTYTGPEFVLISQVMEFAIMWEIML